jgi:hypothetical protein
MPEKKRDPEIEALQAVHAALKPLSADERSRVLASVYALLGIQGAEPVPAAQAPRAPAATAPALTPEAHVRSTARPLSITELVQDKSPGTNAQKITLFAYYRDKHEGQQRFGRDDLKAYFAKAKEQPPRNYDRDFVEAVKKGWLHEDGGESYVTSKGVEAVEAAFAGQRKYSTRPGPRRTLGRSKSKKKPVHNVNRRLRRS